MFVPPVSLLHRSRRLIAALFLLVPLASRAQPAVAVAGTMPEDYLPQLRPIIDAALKQGPTMLLQNINLAQVDSNLLANEVAFWPSVGASGSYSVNYASAGGGFNMASGVYYSLNFNEQLFAWGANKAAADVARLGVQIARRQWAEAFRTLASSLRSQYLSLINQKMALRNAASQLQMSKTDLARQEQLLKDGSVPEGAVSVIRLSVQQQTLSVDQGTQAFVHARRMFAHMAGLEDLPDEAVPVEIPHPDPAPAIAQAEGLVHEFVHNGVEDTPTGQVYVMQLKQSDLNYWIQRTRLYPKFSAAASYNVSNSQVVIGNTVSQSLYKSYNFGLTGSWNIFDGFSTRAGKLSVLASKHSTERQLKDYVDGTTETALDQQKQVEFASRTLDLQETALTNMKGSLSQAQGDLKEGTIAQVAVDALQSAVYTAEYNANVARANFLRTWADFVSLVGADPVLGKIPSNYVKSTHGP